jgi:sensor histidine kinase YesM
VINIKSTLSSWYMALDNRAMAKLSPSERMEVAAFETWTKKNWLQLLLGLGALVAAITASISLMSPGRNLYELATIVLILVVVVLFSLMSAWFGAAQRLEKRKFTSGKTMLGLIVLSVLGGLIGLFSGLYLSGGWDHALVKFQRLAGVAIGATLLFAMVEGGVILLILHIRRQQVERANEALQEQANAEKLARQLTESRLKLMQAQVEPHFLFNTLASVQELAENGAPEAAALIAQLITFLRGGLTGLRNESTTLQREFDMAQAYLNIMKVRMGDRLQFSLELPPEMASLSVPPAMLISLVENAIKHGLEPAVSGGRITVSAFAQDEKIGLRVTDSGIGVNTSERAPQGINATEGGVGLNNIRERLQAMYSDAATLIVGAAGEGTGFVATLLLPKIQTSKNDTIANLATDAKPLNI